MTLYLQLFLSFFQIGLFSIGGGYVAMPLIQSQTVYIHGWLTQAQFADLITIAEMTPGPISINAATFIGIKIAGIPGALIATFGNVLPSFVIMLILAKLYERFRKQTIIRNVLTSVRPIVVAAILTAGLILLEFALESFKQPNIFAIIVFLVAYILINSKKVPMGPVAVLGIGGLIGLAKQGIIYLLEAGIVVI